MKAVPGPVRSSTASRVSSCSPGITRGDHACRNAQATNGGCEEFAKRSYAPLQPPTAHRKSSGADSPEVPPIVHEVLGAAGQPLHVETRAFMESRLGHDFSRVVIHTDSRAAEAAQSVNASAYTVGRHVVFGAGQYVPDTPAGRRLLVHELAHVMQQDGSSVPGTAALHPNAPADRFEQEADRVADAVTESESRNSRTNIASAGLSRKPASLQRSAKFVDSSPKEDFNLAERVFSREHDAGNTNFVLNGTPFGPGSDLAKARGALNTGAITSGPAQGGKECWLSSEPKNEVTYDMKVLKPGSWRQVTTAAKVAALIPSLKKCEEAGDKAATFVIKENEALRKRVLTHERHHASDYKTIFNDVLVPWDAKMAAAVKNVSKMKGKDESTCQNFFYRQFIKQQPDDVATSIINNINKKAKDFHDTAEGRKVNVSVKDVTEGCNVVKAEAE